MTTRELTYVKAFNEGMFQIMAEDPDVFLIGEDVAGYGGVFHMFDGLLAEYGGRRVKDTPIAEQAIIGLGVGAAARGLRPVCDLMFMDFVGVAMDQIFNQAAKMKYMFGGAVSVPLTITTAGGAGMSAAAQHSQSLEAWFAHVPGLKVVQPATPHDAKGMLLAAIEDPDPVMFFEHKLLYKTKGPVPEGYYTEPLHEARVRREGEQVTIAANSIMVHRALEAAAELAREGISAEVIDLRSLRPIDYRCVIDSVTKTTRLVCVYEGTKQFGIGTEVAAAIAESAAFDRLDAPIIRLGGADCPLPYNPDLERAAVPQVPDIVAAVRQSVHARD